MAKNQASYIPSLRFDAKAQQTWTTAGNTHTVTDPEVRSDSIILIYHDSAHAGRWYISSITDRTSFVITSSDVEAATTTTFKYLIL